jgi:predicted dehydrogenase
MKFLIIGCGSIGQRHIQNLIKLGFQDIEIFDFNKELASNIAKKFKVRYIKKLQFNTPDCTLICTPPSSHTELAIKALENNSHVFIEKPLSNRLVNIEKISKIAKEKSFQVFVGYVFRFDKGLRTIKNILESKKIGKIISFDAYEGWYLPNWRPWQNYKKSYTGSEKLGGGIILDSSHELNYLQWFAGNIKEVFCYDKKIKSLGVKTEGLAEILLNFKSKAIGHIHLDFINPNYTRRCEILGEKGSIKWNFDQKTLEIKMHKQKKSIIKKYGNDTNQMYLEELKHVIKCIKKQNKNLINLNDAKNTLIISLNIKKSAKLGKVIKTK